MRLITAWLPLQKLGSATVSNEAEKTGLLKRLVQDILAAFMLLSRVPVQWEKVSNEAPDIGRAMWAYPVVGLFVGGCSAAVYLLAIYISVPSLLAIIIALIVSVFVTGAFHEDGLADVADGFGGGLTREKKLEIMRDSRIGTYGGLALILAIALKVSSLAQLPPLWVVKAVVIGAVVSRVMIIVTARVLPPARKNSLATEAGKPSVVIMVSAFVIAGATTYLLAGYWPLFVVIGVALMVTLFFCRLAYTQVQGFSGDILGATQQISEISIFVTLATLWQQMS